MSFVDASLQTECEMKLSNLLLTRNSEFFFFSHVFASTKKQHYGISKNFIPQRHSFTPLSFIIQLMEKAE